MPKKPGHSGTLADIVRRRMVVDDLMRLGLSIRGIAAARGYRAPRCIAPCKPSRERKRRRKWP